VVSAAPWKVRDPPGGAARSRRRTRRTRVGGRPTRARSDAPPLGAGGVAPIPRRRLPLWSSEREGVGAPRADPLLPPWTSKRSMRHASHAPLPTGTTTSSSRRLPRWCLPAPVPVPRRVPPSFLRAMPEPDTADPTEGRHLGADRTLGTTAPLAARGARPRRPEAPAPRAPCGATPSATASAPTPPSAPRRRGRGRPRRSGSA
jgi:hypothetical protein